MVSLIKVQPLHCHQSLVTYGYCNREMSEAVTSDLKARLSKVTQERDISLQEAQAAADKLEEVKRKRNELIDSSREYQRVINELQDQLEDVTQRLVGVVSG